MCRPSVGVVALIAAALGLWVGCACAPDPVLRGVAIWVNRWDYRTRADLVSIFEHCRAVGAHSVLLQVRGGGSLTYPSSLEPRSQRHDQAGDLLADAVVAAHRRGLRVLAWVNLLVGCTVVDDRPSDDRLLQAHPHWFLRDAQGKLVGEGNYRWLDPRQPEVRRHLVAICVELAERYGIDGLHIDYVRMPDAAAVAAMPETKAAVSQLVVEIRAGLRRLRRDCPLTAAVIGDVGKARQKLGQDWPAWANAGQVDAVYPMLYRLSQQDFTSRLDACVRAAGRTSVVAGIGVHWHDSPAESLRLMTTSRRRGAAGVALYGYAKTTQPPWPAALAGARPTHVN